MALTLNFKEIQTADASQLYLLDSTGAVSSGSPTSWGAPNNSLSDVVSVDFGGTFYPYPSGTAPIVIPPVTIMPTTPNPLPYVLWQQFIITPASINFPYATFIDGWLLSTITVNTSLYTITDQNNSLNVYAVGDTITNVTLNKVIGVVQSVPTAHSIVLTSVTSIVVNPGNVIKNQNNVTVTLSGSATAVFTNTAFLCNVPLLITCNSDCSLGKNLLSFDPFCKDCGATNILYGNEFMTLMGAKAQAGVGAVNSALDDLAYLSANLLNNCINN